MLGFDNIDEHAATYDRVVLVILDKQILAISSEVISH